MIESKTHDLDFQPICGVGFGEPSRENWTRYSSHEVVCICDIRRRRL